MLDTASVLLRLGHHVDAALTDNLTRGLAARSRKELPRTPGTIHRLRRSAKRYREAFGDVDVLLSPVLCAHHSDDRPPVTDARLRRAVRTAAQLRGFTPLNNATGSPAMSLPLGSTSSGLPVGVHLCADLGDERTLLELAYEVEDAQPFHRIQATAV